MGTSARGLLGLSSRRESSVVRLTGISDPDDAPGINVTGSN